MNRRVWTTAAILCGLSGALAEEKPTSVKVAWRPLFDGKSLAGWEIAKFGGQGEVKVENGKLILDKGDDMTGVAWTRPFPTMNYEIQLEAERAEGSDFFCGLTFPVEKSFCSLICGGWGGGVVGLSSIDGRDASENETTSYRDFESKRWYKIRVRVVQGRIEAWIDGKQVVNVETAERRFTTRSEMELCKPLGLATWRTTGQIRDFKYRELQGADARPQSPKPSEE